MKKAVSILALLVLAMNVAIAQDSVETEAADGADELVKAKSSFKETWVHPDADFTKYDKVYLWEAIFEYRDVGPAQRTRSTMLSTRNREFGISEEGRAKFEEAVSEAFVKELLKGKNFEISESIDSSTMLLRGSALDIISNVPPDTIGRSQVYLATIGEATLVLELLDAETGKVLAMVSERRKMQQNSGRIDQFSMPTNNATILAEVRRWGRSAASKLRKELDKAVVGR